MDQRVSSPASLFDAPASSQVALIVDDDAPTRRRLQQALKACGWKVHEAERWMAGLIAAGVHGPDLIVLNPELPDGDGVSFIRDVRFWSHVPLIVLSHGSAGHPALLEAGADACLARPLDLEKIMLEVARYTPVSP